MKTNISRNLFAATVLGIALAACAGSPTTKSTGEVMTDSAIATKVKSQLLADPDVSGLEIQVETFKGTVQLAGFATNPSQIAKAGDIARNTSGVKAVRNDIRLKQGG